MKGALLVLGGRKTPLSPEIGDSGLRSLHTCYFFTNLLPKPKLCLNSLLIKHPKLSFFVLSIPLIFIASLSKKYKSYLLWPLLRSHFYATSMCTQIKWVSFSPVHGTQSVLCQFYDWSSHRNSRGEKGKCPLPDSRISGSHSHTHKHCVAEVFLFKKPSHF